MDWIEVAVTVSPQSAEAVSNLLMEEGAGGVVDLSPDVRVAYFPEQADIEARLDRIRRSVAGLGRFGLDPGPGLVAWRKVVEESWAEAWKAYFYPLKVGQRIVIRPTWRPYTPGPNDLVLDLDPGMAFGTGSHPTTTLCIRALEEAVRPGCTVFDIGTGSGILAIAAALLGACEVVACDNDPVAVDVARRNAAQNGVDTTVTVLQGSWPELVAMKRTADVVVANIVADVIQAMATEVTRLVTPGGRFIASGITVDRTEQVERALRTAGWNFVRREVEGEWTAVTSSLSTAMPAQPPLSFDSVRPDKETSK